MRRWLAGAALGASSLLAACGGDATSPTYALDLAEIGTAPVSRWLQVPDSARVGEPFVVTAFATNRGCETPGGLSVTQTDGRVRIVGAVQVASGGERVCPTPGGWSQATTLTPIVEGALTIVLIGRIGDHTDSVSRIVRVVPRAVPLGSLAGTALDRRARSGDD